MASGVPPISYASAPRDGHNTFRVQFSHLSDAEWCELLVRSIDEPVIDGVQFPAFPDDNLQRHLHGGSGVSALHEAAAFFRFVKAQTYKSPRHATGKRLLDFGSGWGRMVRPFMRDFDFTDLYAFEPDFLFCTLARTLNPYVTVLSGTFVPNGSLPSQFFHIVASWSVFSHLSPGAAVLWLVDLARAVIPGGTCVITTWGMRFLQQLRRDAERRRAGQGIHWYSSVCLDAAGRIEDRIAEYEEGEFVWFTNGGSSSYGEAFVSEAALRHLLVHYQIPFALTLSDSATLGQDAFVLTRL